MPKFIEMDENVTLSMQMEEKGGPVILINKFTLVLNEVEPILQAWAEHAAFMKRQSGFISAQLHRGIGGSCVFINYGVWESVEDFKRAFTHPESQALSKHYPPSLVASPHLFKKVAVPRICVV